MLKVKDKNGKYVPATGKNDVGQAKALEGNKAAKDSKKK